MAYFVYVLWSEKDGRLYKGQTSDLDRRIKQHSSGENKYSEKFLTRAEAVLREKYFKSGIGREFLKEKLL